MNDNDRPRTDRRRSSRRRSGRGGRQSAEKKERTQPQNQAGPAQKGSNPDRSRSQANGADARNRGGESRARSSESSARSAPSSGNDRRARPAEAPRASDRFLNLADRLFDRSLDQSRKRAYYQGDRPTWVPPKLQPSSLPKPTCPRCGEIIEDLASAMSDRQSGEPAHFDCVLKSLEEQEHLGADEKIVYIGGGRFGVVFFENPSDPRRFQIRRILQWEEKEKRSSWRAEVADQYSNT